MVSVSIKQFKTDPFFCRGRTIRLGGTGNALCPLAAVLAHAARRGARHAPLFSFCDGSLLSRRRLVDKLLQALSATRVNGKLYLGHSFRIVAATTVAARRVDDSTISAPGRRGSDAYHLYIRLDANALAEVTRTLAV